MPTLPEIKSRLNSTKDTKKITQALQLVAASKMKLFQKKAINTRTYAFSLLNGLKLVSESLSESIYIKPGQGKASLFVLMTSDKGLCGTLNQRLIASLFNSAAWKNLRSEERMLISFGKKSLEAAKRMGVTPVKSYEGIGENLTPLKALEIIDEILSFWNNGSCQEIVLVSPHYVNPFLSQVTHKTLLPFSPVMAQSHLKLSTSQIEENNYVSSSQTTIIEPDEERLADKLCLELIHALFTQNFYELKASEYSSRMVSMKKATDAATDMISQLDMEYNKLRQAIITQQLAELASASEAMDEEEAIEETN
jgi:F-type H+-transporting ATPase subunit gamma